VDGWGSAGGVEARRPGKAGGLGGHPSRGSEEQKSRSSGVESAAPGPRLRSRSTSGQVRETSDPILRTAGPPAHTHVPGDLGVSHGLGMVSDGEVIRQPGSPKRNLGVLPATAAGACRFGADLGATISNIGIHRGSGPVPAVTAGQRFQDERAGSDVRCRPRPIFVARRSPTGPSPGRWAQPPLETVSVSHQQPPAMTRSRTEPRIVARRSPRGPPDSPMYSPGRSAS
jgi:hypothetical protein